MMALVWAHMIARRIASRAEHQDQCHQGKPNGKRTLGVGLALTGHPLALS
jgi:hypothetical protein